MLAGKLRTGLVLALVVGVGISLYGLPSAPSAPSAPGDVPGSKDRPPATLPDGAYTRLPMSFAPNRGQAPPEITHMAQGVGFNLWLGRTEAVLGLSRSPGGESRPTDRSSSLDDAPRAGRWTDGRPDDAALLRMQLLGASPAARPEAEVPLLGRANYLVGHEPNRQQVGLPTFGRVTYREVYPGIDVSYYGNQGQFEYDFVVAPGSDPSTVDLGFEGAQGVRVDGNGDLVVTVAGSELRQQAPVLYQGGNDAREPVLGAFVVRDGGQVGFDVGAYDRSRALVIDPTLAYSSFLGAGGLDSALSIAVDDQGSAYVVGATTSPSFPTTPGAYDASFNGDQDAFVAKLTPDGSALVYSTFLGGSATDDADSVAVDARGNAYLRGITFSSDFPTTPRAFDPSFNGGVDAYVTKLSRDGSFLRYSTFLGGSGFDSGSGIAVDRTGAAYVPGITGSPEFPTTPGAYQTEFQGVGGPLPPPNPGDFDAYLTKLASNGSSLEYSTFLGASRLEAGFEVAVGSRGEAYVAGVTVSPDFPTTPGAYDSTLGGPRDPFVARFNRDGSALVYSTLLGGSGPEGALGLAVDMRGSAYVTGQTPSADFPTTPGAFDLTANGGDDTYVSKLTPDGSALAYSTFLGGSGAEGGYGLAVNVSGEAYVTGGTSSPDFATTPTAFDTTFNGDTDGFLTVLTRDGSGLAHSTFLGGSGYDNSADVAVDVRGVAYVSGETFSPDFPTTPGVFDRTYNGDSDAFVTKVPPHGRRPRR